MKVKLQEIGFQLIISARGFDKLAMKGAESDLMGIPKFCYLIRNNSYQVDFLMFFKVKICEGS